MPTVLYHYSDIENSEMWLYLTTSVLYDIINYVRRGIDGPWRSDLIRISRQHDCKNILADLAIWEYSVTKGSFPRTVPRPSDVYRLYRAVNHFYVNDVLGRPTDMQNRELIISECKRVSSLYNGMYAQHVAMYPKVHEAIVEYLNIAGSLRASVSNKKNALESIDNFIEMTRNMVNLNRARYICIKYLYEWPAKAKGLTTDIYNTASDILFQYNCEHSIGLLVGDIRINLLFATFDKEEGMVDRSVVRKVSIRDKDNCMNGTINEIDFSFIVEPALRKKIMGYMMHGKFT